MHVSWQQLRSVTLAQAIEHADSERTLVSQTEWDEATRQAVAAARGRGAAPVGVADVVLERAAAVVARAAGRDATVAALQQPGTPARWLARGLPLAALLLGLALDRIANAHRVDLLSPPLLLVLGWNLAIYALLLWHAWRRPAHEQAHGLPAALLHWVLRRQLPGSRAARRGLAARIAADFYARWSALALARFTQQAACVLHLSAAAWAAGIALSLLLRGLVVSYHFGWESTFLDAAQVHAIVSLLFAPLTLLLGLAPFSLQEIAATQNFAGEGAAGARWVWMYVGLLALVVVLPRLLLAAWAGWRQARLARQGRLDLQGGGFDTLRQALPADLCVGLLCAAPAQEQALRILLAQHAEHGAMVSAQGDRLRLLRPSDAATPVDAVIAWGDGPAPEAPAAWQQAPRLALGGAEFGPSWVQDGVLLERLAALLPAQQPALERLQQAWQAGNEARFAQSLQALAGHLRACAALVQAGQDAAHYTRLLQELDATLGKLHGHGAPPAQPPRQLPAATPAAPTRTGDGTALAMGTSAGAAAGAAAGAKVGAMIDLGTGGMTLGVGTALGALLGGTTAWALRTLQKKGEKRDDTDELQRHMVEAACTRYLVLSHLGRLPARQADDLGAHWHAEVTGTVAAHWPQLAAALQAGPAPADPLQALLQTMLRGILQRSRVPRAPG
ncbi:MAG: DUF2868 domain-containing protein [Proteobacteria bacterium]|nr:DUF2868 domain-containing protein [Pseudomonadota bacterium]MBS0608126.1 DUF2868 domain-containing protein [Pseudomonadota bacterium]